jgi:RES domain
LADCAVEVFGDTGTIEPSGYSVALVEIRRPLRLLELRGAGAWDAGTVAAIAKEADRSLSQEWARFIYSEPGYGLVDGISYGNAHNDKQAYALFERAGTMVVIDSCPLADPRLRGELDDIALTLHMVIDP